jgi:hypothetical protein
MADQNQKEGRVQGTESNLEQMLDAALAKYAAVEPRAGLEDRILASVRAEQARPGKNAWWQRNIWHWGLAAAIAAIVIVAVGVTVNLAKHAQPFAKNPPSLPTLKNGTQEPDTQFTKHNEAAPKRELARHVITQSNQSKTVAEARPKLDQFPSAQPLSVQEKLLLEYVRQHPDEALRTAKAQEEFDTKIHADLLQATTQTGPSGSDQQER